MLGGGGEEGWCWSGEGVSTGSSNSRLAGFLSGAGKKKS